MTNEQEPVSKQIIEMSMAEKIAASAADPEGYYRRALDEERPRAAQQVNLQLQRRRLGREGMTGSET